MHFSRRAIEAHKALKPSLRRLRRSSTNLADNQRKNNRNQQRQYKQRAKFVETPSHNLHNRRPFSMPFVRSIHLLRPLQLRRRAVEIRRLPPASAADARRPRRRHASAAG